MQCMQMYTTTTATSNNNSSTKKVPRLGTFVPRLGTIISTAKKQLVVIGYDWPAERLRLAGRADTIGRQDGYDWPAGRIWFYSQVISVISVGKSWLHTPLHTPINSYLSVGYKESVGSVCKITKKITREHLTQGHTPCEVSPVWGYLTVSFLLKNPSVVRTM